ncbi:MAG: trehalose-phosphatase [Kofleriaceae bacterium]|nr:trehalose-phosphatase [Kofleriaceae bacterium]
MSVTPAKARLAPMLSILGEKQRLLLQGLTGPDALVVFDFDGTLAPLVADRDNAVMRPATAALFQQVCATYRCAIITGRAIADVQARLAGATVISIIGNHGMEPALGLDASVSDVRELLPQLVAKFSAEPMFEIEDKTYSLTIHYRRHAFRQKARALVLRAVEQLAPQMRVVEGKCVVNLLPLTAPHKGDALAALRRTYAATVTLFVGDDVTDEDVFELPADPDLITVRVGQRKNTAARYFLRNQREIDSLLRRMLVLRTLEPTHENLPSGAQSVDT